MLVVIAVVDKQTRKHFNSILTYLHFTGCGGKPADVYFVIDTSNDVTERELERQKQFLADLAPLFYMGQRTSQIGVITYGSNVVTVATLGAYRETSHLQVQYTAAAFFFFFFFKIK